MPSITEKIAQLLTHPGQEIDSCLEAIRIAVHQRIEDMQNANPSIDASPTRSYTRDWGISADLDILQEFHRLPPEIKEKLMHIARYAPELLDSIGEEQ